MNGTYTIGGRRERGGQGMGEFETKAYKIELKLVTQSENHSALDPLLSKIDAAGEKAKENAEMFKTIYEGESSLVCDCINFHCIHTKSKL